MSKLINGHRCPSSVGGGRPESDQSTSQIPSHGMGRGAVFQLLLNHPVLAPSPVEAQLAAPTPRVTAYPHDTELFTIAALNFDVGVTSLRPAITIHGQYPVL